MTTYALTLDETTRGRLLDALDLAADLHPDPATADAVGRLRLRVVALAPTTRAPHEVPPEPPVGTWTRDRFGGVSKRHPNGRWAPPGCVPLATWEARWAARGPLEECGPWGAPLERT